MCFSPQRRTILRQQNFQKWSRTLSFLTFLLPNVLFATAACNFWCHLSAPTSAPAALTDLLLDWPDTRIYEKTQHFVTSLTFGADVSSFLLTFWLLHLLSTDLTTPLLLFNSPYCRKFLFKLPSIILCFFALGFILNFKPFRLLWAFFVTHKTYQNLLCFHHFHWRFKGHPPVRHGEPIKPGDGSKFRPNCNTQRGQLVKHLNLTPKDVNGVCQFGAALKIWQNYFCLLALLRDHVESVNGTPVITACLSKGFSGSVL